MKTLLLTALMMTTLANAQTRQFRGGESGGGGDASELRVNEIRADILNWINLGGSKGLQFYDGLTLEEYNDEMKKILKFKTVIIGFVEDDSSSDEELRVSVDGKPKTCRGFYSIKTQKPHILCSIPRFAKTSSEDQYRLIHHEFAGLVSLEQNSGAASDYNLSEQITEFLTPQTVLKLGIKKGATGNASLAALDSLIQLPQGTLLVQKGIIERGKDSVTYDHSGPNWTQYEKEFRGCWFEKPSQTRVMNLRLEVLEVIAQPYGSTLIKLTESPLGNLRCSGLYYESWGSKEGLRKRTNKKGIKIFQKALGKDFEITLP